MRVSLEFSLSVCPDAHPPPPPPLPEVAWHYYACRSRMTVNSTVLGNVFRRATALAWSMFTKLYPFAWNRKSCFKLCVYKNITFLGNLRMNTWIILSPGWRILDAGPSGWTLVTKMPWEWHLRSESNGSCTHKAASWIAVQYIKILKMGKKNIHISMGKITDAYCIQLGKKALFFGVIIFFHVFFLGVIHFSCFSD